MLGAFCELFILACLGVTTLFDGAPGFKRSLNSKAHAFKEITYPTRAGKKAQKLEVRAGDCGYNTLWNDCASDRERIEYSSYEHFKMKEERWIAWSFYLPINFIDVTPSRTSLGQVHHIEDPSAYTSSKKSHPPLLQFNIEKGRYVLHHHSLRGNREWTKAYPLGTLDDLRNAWTDVVLHIRFDKENGFCEVYINGELKVTIAENLLSFSPESFYFKYGLYRSYVSRYDKWFKSKIPTQVVYYDEIRIGGDRFSVDPYFNSNLDPVD